MIKEATEKITGHEHLSRAEMETVIEEIMSGETETPLIVSFLTALSDKGETIEELTGAVTVMRRHVTAINVRKKEVVLDTCGTGGDKKGTFNISTVVAFVTSGCGIIVAKHGNRSVSSRCGSADILEALGVNIHLTKEQIESCLNDIGICFLFAQNLHPAMKHVMPARKTIGKRTMFNILGPLTNPAGAAHQLLGVYNSALTETLARVLANLGTVHALLVHGQDGLDEVSTIAGTTICELRKGEFKNFELQPEDYGFKKTSLESLAGGSAQENAAILLELLKGKKGPQRDIVILNAACALYAADKTNSIIEGIALAERSIDSGKAFEKLELLKEYSNRK
ncbi:MAG: anthranilate phosphoribosyltransferase [Candidatus Omnitrophota bacterium]|jgi:anthranilate phosphoribosyltransferase